MNDTTTPNDPPDQDNGSETPHVAALEGQFTVEESLAETGVNVASLRMMLDRLDTLLSGQERWPWLDPVAHAHTTAKLALDHARAIEFHLAHLAAGVLVSDDDIVDVLDQATYTIVAADGRPATR